MGQAEASSAKLLRIRIKPSLKCDEDEDIRAFVFVSAYDTFKVQMFAVLYDDAKSEKKETTTSDCI